MIDHLPAYKSFHAQVKAALLAENVSDLRAGVLRALKDFDSAAGSIPLGGVVPDPCVFGEELRAQVFSGPGLGCYSNFSVSSGFVPVPTESTLGRQALGCLFDGVDPLYVRSVMGSVHIYASPVSVAAWYWDGDGTLLVGRLRDGVITCAVVNDDCKKDYVWKWVGELGVMTLPVGEVY